MPKLHYLPTTDELRERTLSAAQRKRRESEERRLDRLYLETARILLARGINPSTCPMNYCYEAFAEAKKNFEPDPLIS
jgi:hypothetical protein